MGLSESSISILKLNHFTLRKVYKVKLINKIEPPAGYLLF